VTRTEGALVALFLCGTLVLGTLLRFALAGVPLSFGDFAHLRHAHSHLGYYGVLFPLLWLGWRAAGARAPSATVFAVYAGATVVSTIGFATRGYWLPSIAGSTVVGLVWLHAAWQNRAWLRELRSWTWSAPLGVVIASCFVPPIALYTRRDPAFANELVRTFLGVLVFAVFVPSALARLRAPPPVGPLWLVAALAGSLWLGVGVHDALSLGLIALGAWAGVGAARASVPSWLRAHWVALALALLALGAGALPKDDAVSVAGLHFAFLGPLLCTWVLDVDERGPPAWLWAAWSLSVAAMCGGVLFASPRASVLSLPPTLFASVAAWGGVAICAVALGGLALYARRR
jgi:hypothetical protein